MKKVFSLDHNAFLSSVSVKKCNVNDVLTYYNRKWQVQSIEKKKVNVIEIK
jgi:hypothetical protein